MPNPLDRLSWNNVKADPNAGMGYALRGSRMLASALQNLDKPLDEYNMAQKENALNKQKANTGAYKDQILQGKKPELKGFYSSGELADARRQYAKDALDKRLRLAAEARAQAQAARQAQKFKQDIADRAAMEKARKEALAGMTSTGMPATGSVGDFTSYDDMNRMTPMVAEGTPAPGSVGSSISPAQATGITAVNPTGMPYTTDDYGEEVYVNTPPRPNEEIAPWKIEPTGAARDIVDFKKETAEPSYKEEVQANSILDQRLANAQRNRASDIAAARPGQTGLHDLAVADNNYRKELSEIAKAKNTIAQSADSKDQAFQNAYNTFQLNKRDRQNFTPEPYESVTLDPAVTNPKEIRTAIDTATDRASKYETMKKNPIRRYYQERIRMAKTKEEKENLRKEKKDALEVIDSMVKPQKDLIKTWDKRLSSTKKDAETVKANSKLNAADVFSKLEPKGNALVDDTDRARLNKVISYIQTRYPGVSNKKFMDFIEQGESMGLFDKSDQFFGSSRFGVDAWADTIKDKFDEYAAKQGIKSKLKN